MNAFINVKTTEKNLQFGTKKCKSLLVGKNTENVTNTKLMVDNWESRYETEGDETKLFKGLVDLDKLMNRRTLVLLSQTKVTIWQTSIKSRTNQLELFGKYLIGWNLQISKNTILNLPSFS